MVGYYCNKNSCEQVPIKDLNENGNYNNFQVYRHKGCWNRCKNLEQSLHLKNTDTSNKKIKIIVISIITLIILGICIIIKLKL